MSEGDYDYTKPQEIAEDQLLYGTMFPERMEGGAMKEKRLKEIEEKLHTGIGFGDTICLAEELVAEVRRRGERIKELERRVRVLKADERRSDE